MREADLTRREALRYGLGGVAFVCSFRLDKFAKPLTGTTAAGARRKLAAAFDPFQVDLPIPRTLAPAARTAARDEYAITMRDGVARILPGLETPVSGYEGSFPGPTIRARRGRPVHVTQTQRARRGARRAPARRDHAAGLRRAPGADHRAGRVARLRLPERPAGRDALVPRPRHGDDGRTLYDGLAAFYLLEDDDEAGFDLPQGEYDVPLMIHDRAFNADGSFRYRFDVDLGFRGDTILVNGAVAPRMKVAAAAATGCGSSTRPTRARTSSCSATAAR